jgi:glycosyltransferase involved in cell wall biosynthesis
MKNTFPHKIKDHCMKADAIIAISEYTKRQLIELLEIPSSRIYTIKHGIDPFFQECAPEEEKLEIRKKYNLPASYLLFVGTQEPRKNLSVLIEAFRRIRDRNVHLVLAGPAGWSVEQDELTGERILRTGYVSKQDLRAMYQQAVAVVFPSVEEGFGLPLLEGMASRVPVIASRIPVFQEICNDSCAYFDPERPEELRNAIDEIVDNPELRKELIEKGIQRLKNFSWKETARKTLELYRSL